MSLPSSGSLSILNSAGAGRSIAQEVNGNLTPPKSLTTLSVAAGKTAPHGMLEFYNYSSVITFTIAPSILSGSASLTNPRYKINSGAITSYSSPVAFLPTDTLTFYMTFANGASTAYEAVRLYATDGSQFATTTTTVLNPNGYSGSTATLTLSGITHGSSFTVYGEAASTSPPVNNVSIDYDVGQWTVFASRPMIGNVTFQSLTAQGYNTSACTGFVVESSTLFLTLLNGAQSGSITDNNLTCGTSKYKFTTSMNIGGTVFANGANHIIGTLNNITASWSSICDFYDCPVVSGGGGGGPVCLLGNQELIIDDQFNTKRVEDFAIGDKVLTAHETTYELK